VPKTASLKNVYFFTARVDGRGGDPTQPQRQDAYWRALRSLPGVIVKEGQFKTRPKRLPLATPPASGSKFAEVLVTEEKGSDVNLATQLLLDGANKAVGTAVVVSDDFDLQEPLRVARYRMGLEVGVVSPRERRWLANSVPANFYRPLKERWLTSSQLPASVIVDGRTVSRPTGWI
jgi:uncharacterized LabA/DUF88 family protein